MAANARATEQGAPPRIATAPPRDAEVEAGGPPAGEQEASAAQEAAAKQEAPAAQELDSQTRERRDAALARVRKLGDPALRASALPVERFDERLQEQIAHMGELMVDALGIGLAATQVGVLNRVLVYRVDPEDPVTALVNPTLEWTSEELDTAEEGCLSLPGVHVEVERPARVRARARNEAGEELVIEAEGLHARVIQHEIDHLDGILILDRISREARKEAMRAMREARAGEAAEGAHADRDAPAREGEAAAEDSGRAAERAPDPNAIVA
jgi:peptide deformylase